MYFSEKKSKSWLQNSSNVLFSRFFVVTVYSKNLKWWFLCDVGRCSRRKMLQFFCEIGMYVVRRTMRCYNVLNSHIVTNPTKGQTPHLSSFSAGYSCWSFLNIFGVLCCILKTEIIFGTRGTLSINLSWLINFFSKIENGKKQCRNSSWIVPSSSKQHTGKRKIALHWLLFFFDVHRKIIISTTIVLNDFCFGILNIQLPSNVYKQINVVWK